jgi:NAD(P)-dependent dehydrogenase (short-subunit alcohol dehydrogenase family)
MHVWRKNSDKGIRVHGVCPGMINTPMAVAKNIGHPRQRRLSWRGRS